MESLEVSAKTVEEAVESALKQLNLTRDQVEIAVLNKGKSGFLGMGSEEAVVRVTPLSTEGDEKGPALVARAALEDLLEKMGLVASVDLISSEQLCDFFLRTVA